MVGRLGITTSYTLYLVPAFVNGARLLFNLVCLFSGKLSKKRQLLENSKAEALICSSCLSIQQNLIVP